MKKLVLVLACVGCAAADSTGGENEESTTETSLAGGVTLQEVSVPAEVTDAMAELTGSDPAVRRFTISAPASVNKATRVRGAVEGLYARTKSGGSYSLKKFCASLPTPKTTASGCAKAILDVAVAPGDFADYLESWSGDFPEAVDVMQSYIGTVGDEMDLVVPVGHWEDGEFWLDWTAHRAILFDAAVSQVIIVRYYTSSSL